MKRKMNRSKSLDTLDDLFGTEVVGLPKQRAFTQQSVVNITQYYLVDALETMDDGVELCNILRTAASTDVVILRINCVGGRFDVGTMIINAIEDSEATVIGYIEQSCASMATLIFLACDDWQVSKYGEMMIHTSSYGTGGKDHEVYAYSKFTHEQNDKRIKDAYAGFLTQQEIQHVLNGGDIYLTEEDINVRLNDMLDHREDRGTPIEDFSKIVS